MFPRESITFRCTVDVSSGWEYLWYHNSQGILPSKSNKYAIPFLDHSHSGQYFCKAKRGKDSSFSTEASETTSLQVSDPPTPTLKPLSPWLDVFEDELVELKCEVNNPDWTITWYKNRVELEEDIVLYLDEDLLNITLVSQTYQGVYACRASLPSRGVSSEFSNTANVTVYENIPKPTLSKQPAINSMYAGETVHFTCKVDFASGWEYQWYKNEHELTDTNKTISISLGVSDGGEYSCTATRSERTSTTISEKIRQEVLEIPVPSLKPVTQWLDVFPTESVKMSCGMQVSSDWTYTWYKDEKELQAVDAVLFGTDGTTLSISSASSSHRGKYSCSAKLKSRSVSSNHSSPLTLTVYDKKPTVTLEQDPEYKVMFPTESVTFTCYIDVSSEWKYMWYKDGNQLVATANTHSISHIGIQDGGSYTCQMKRGINQVFTTDSSQPIDLQVEANTPKPLMTQQPDVEKLYTGELVTFECTVKISSGWTYHWNKDGAQVLTNSSTFKIDVTHLSDSGTYECNATRDQTMLRTEHSDGRTLHISEIPVPSLKPVTQWLDVFPTESVMMSCGMQVSSDWTYTWYKDEKELQADDAVLFDTDGTTLSISSASSSHRGKYSCSAKLKSRSVSSNHSSPLTLTVYDKKPTVTLEQDPEYKVMFPTESVTFTCHIDVSSEWKYMWYKDGNQLVATANTHSISHIGIQDGGSYTCQMKRGINQVFTTDFSQPIDLQVEPNTPKPLMTQQPDVEKLYTGELVTFECTVKISSGWTYHWNKDGAQVLTNSSTFKIDVTRLSDSGTYECNATRDQTMLRTEHSDGRTLHISEIPVPSLKPVTQWLDVFPTESVNMSCGMQVSSDWTYTWYKDEKELQADGAVLFDTDGTTLSINSTSSSHRGKYSCSAKLKSRSVSSNHSLHLTLDVYDTKPRVMLMQDPTHSLMHTGDSVSFSCHTNVSSGWEYLWYKDGSPLDPFGNNYNISSVVTTHTGSYECQAKRGTGTIWHSEKSQAVRLDVEERPQASIILLTGWSEVFSTDSLVLRCEVMKSSEMWNYTWFKEGQRMDPAPSDKYIVTPQNDPEQSLYTCQGSRTGRPSYSRSSESFKTQNLLLKRRVLLSISGCLFFGIIAVFLGCIILRVIRKPVDDDDKPEEASLFLTMAQLKDCADAPYPLAEYITDADLNALPKEGNENGTICSETTPLPITLQEDQAVLTDVQKTTENNGGLVSFQQ
ncbi:hemicentin-1 [Embiotoca jacksoni]|uniref:hemicentin-1 n=1 Tax=Embiotoca jacksoni TaxID=100190 RepID=UPI00370377BD